MNFDLVNAVRPIKVAMKVAAERANVRRLNVFLDRIKCKPGCASCCSRMIYVSIAEALVILEDLESTGKWTETRARCLDQKDLARGSNPVSWFKMNIPCPVLDPSTKMCGAYEVRPTACSTHFVASDPSGCDPWGTSSEQYEPIRMNDLHAEFMAAMEACVDGYGILAYRMPMPTALLFAENIRTMRGLSLDEVIGIIRGELR